jgi:hypothetical protein
MDPKRALSETTELSRQLKAMTESSEKSSGGGGGTGGGETVLTRCPTYPSSDIVEEGALATWEEEGCGAPFSLYKSAIIGGG